jgi:N-methylhydantoinase B
MSSIMPDETSRLSTPDPITAEVVRCAYENIAHEMALVLIRTSGSPVLTEAKDFCAIIFNAKGEQIGSAGYILLHLASSRLAVRRLIELRGSEVQPGEAYICNDPYTDGALHQADVGIVMPIFHADNLIGWTFSNAHLLDVGGNSLGGMSPEAHDCFEEAVRFPLIRIAKDGVIDAAWKDFIMVNFRVPVSFLSDVRSLISACRAGAERAARLTDEYGAEALEQICDYNIRLTEEAFRQRIGKLPEGVAYAYDWVEYDGRGENRLFPVSLELEVRACRLHFRLRGCDQTQTFVNSAQGGAEGNIISPVQCMLAHDIPFNEGIWRCLDIDRGQPGTIVNPQVPAPVSNSHIETGGRIARMAGAVISQVCHASQDELLRGRAAGVSASCSTGTVWFGTNKRGDLGVFFPMDLAASGGGGAQTVGDGQDVYGYQCTLDMAIPDVEVHELGDPFLILWRRYHANSGGAGRHRGGLGIDEGFMIRGGGRHACTSFVSTTELPPRGFAGGYPGGVGMNHIIRNSNIDELLSSGKLPAAAEDIEGTVERIPSKASNVPFSQGEVYWGFSPGAGGLGDPFLRPPEVVQTDLDEGRITAAAAAELYGVVFGDDRRVDTEGSWARREDRRGAIVTTKNRPLRGDAVLSDVGGVRPHEDHWACAHCGAALASFGSNWKEAVVSRRRPLAAVFNAAETSVRGRDAEPAVLTERFCGDCGAVLAVDVEIEGQRRGATIFQPLK